MDTQPMHNHPNSSSFAADVVLSTITGESLDVKLYREIEVKYERDGEEYSCYGCATVYGDEVSVVIYNNDNSVGVPLPVVEFQPEGSDIKEKFDKFADSAIHMFEENHEMVEKNYGDIEIISIRDTDKE